MAHEQLGLEGRVGDADGREAPGERGAGGEEGQSWVARDGARVVVWAEWLADCRSLGTRGMRVSCRLVQNQDVLDQLPSSFVIVPSPCPSSIVALAAPDRLTKKISSGSEPLSPQTRTVIVLLI